MSERPPTRINLERYLERLDRPRAPIEPPAERAAPPSPPTQVLLAQLGASIDQLGESKSAGIRPLLEQVRTHVAALFPAPGAASLDDQAFSAHKERLEELFQTLEGVLYACSLP